MAKEGCDLPNIPLQPKNGWRRKTSRGFDVLGRCCQGLKGTEQAVPEPAGKSNWDESPRAGSIHLSYKPATNSEKTHFPAPRIAILRFVQLCRKVTDFKTGFLFLPAPLPLPLKHGNVAAGCLGVGVMTGSPPEMVTRQRDAGARTRRQDRSSGSCGAEGGRWGRGRRQETGWEWRPWSQTC